MEETSGEGMMRLCSPGMIEVSVTTARVTVFVVVVEAVIGPAFTPIHEQADEYRTLPLQVEAYVGIDPVALGRIAAGSLISRS